ncbi:hypothetical protein JOD63_002901 [Microbacterium terrae]|nr:hypothetical protein [Microbacterium terrae]MBP1078933.1 hypothetical protein [Microbacterium terrae]
MVGLADVPSRIDNQHPVGEIDLAQVEGIECGLLLVSNRFTCLTPAR